MRPRSLALVACMLTMRFEYVRPILIMVAVENEVSTSFCAVPAFIRVEPVTTSGPVSTVIRMSTSSGTGASGFPVTRAVAAPRCRAVRSAASTYGVRPEAVRPRTKSPSATEPRNSAAAASSSSSASSTASRRASGPPAWWGTNQPGGML